MLGSLRPLRSAALLLLLSACATGPTKVLLDPEVLSAGSSLGGGQSVYLEVTSTATDTALSDKQARFALEQPATLPVRNKLATGLARHGFQLMAEPVTRQFQVVVTKADHVISRGLLRDTIAVEIAIQFTASTPAGTRTRTFTDKRSREVGGQATIGEVSGELNQALGQVLARALNDADLIAFLGQ